MLQRQVHSPPCQRPTQKVLASDSRGWLFLRCRRVADVSAMLSLRWNKDVVANQRM